MYCDRCVYQVDGKPSGKDICYECSVCEHKHFKPIEKSTLVNVMPEEQFDFINNIRNYMFLTTNMDEHESYEFAFRIWQSKEWLLKFLTEQKDNNISERSDK